MKRFLNIAFVFLCVGLNANAQKFLEDLTQEKQGEGKVTVSESREIDELVNGKEVVIPVTTPAATNTTRVQVFSGGNTRADRVKAEQVKGAMKAEFPGQPVYTHFYSPRWICRMGNFRTYAEAEKILKQVKAMGYPQAVIVKGKISVAY